MRKRSPCGPSARCRKSPMAGPYEPAGAEASPEPDDARPARVRCNRDRERGRRVMAGAARPLAAAPAMGRLRRRRRQAVLRGRSGQARRPHRLLRVLLDLPAHARVRLDPRVRARGRCGAPRGHPRLGLCGHGRHRAVHPQRHRRDRGKRHRARARHRHRAVGGPRRHDRARTGARPRVERPARRAAQLGRAPAPRPRDAARRRLRPPRRARPSAAWRRAGSSRPHSRRWRRSRARSPSTR